MRFLKGKLLSFLERSEEANAETPVFGERSRLAQRRMTMKTHISRRALAAGLALAPIAGFPGIAGAVTIDDPVFAAIEMHKAAHRAFEDACILTDEVVAEKEGREVTEVDEALRSRCSIAEDQARFDLAHTVPTTRAGAQAALEHLIAHRAEEDISYFARTLVESAVLAG
jgi:hypothetical protein